jgi:phosphoribosylformylglycinamidine cyclo-ligase
MTDSPLTYAASGVDYDSLDAFKRHCQGAAAQTGSFLTRYGMKEWAGTRGESAFLIETPGGIIAHVEEGLGTKNLVADAMLPGKNGFEPYFPIGIDVVAAIVNDMITVGAVPTALAMHVAVGDAAWFGLHGRGAQFASGFAHGCGLAGATWGGGETPVLKSIVNSGAAVLSGSAVGFVEDPKKMVPGVVDAGMEIVFIASSGIHANGITLCRSIAERLPGGFHFSIPGGKTFGEELLSPTAIYVPLIRELLRRSVVPSYIVNVTGHGWRKLMRARGDFEYRITEIGELSPLFKFLGYDAGVELREAYGTFNMGVGFALYLNSSAVSEALAIARDLGFIAWRAGVVEKGKNGRQVTIEPLGMTFGGDELELRG